MAKRGTPLPVNVREQIKQARASDTTVRRVAEALGVSKTTVQKYGKQNGTK